MTTAQAAEIADETIAYWRRQEDVAVHDRVGPGEAWCALTGEWWRYGDWREVRGEMIRWLLENARRKAA